MIIIMQAHATQAQLQLVLARIEALGFRPHISAGSERTIVGVIGDERPVDPEVFEVLEGVERVVRVLHSYKLASRDFHPEDRVIELGNGAKLGGESIMVMAGPCAVETRDQLEAAAALVAAEGVRVLRGGAFKPRTSPYSFQGLGEKGLVMLREVADEHDMAVVTEVITPEDVPAVAEHADMLQIGARNMQNYKLLSAVGEAGRPVLLKRGLGSTIEELLQAAEYILAGGNEHVALCERGIRTFETATRFTLDINAVPVLKHMTSLPVVVDPSHAVGRADLVTPVARAGVAAGADGLLIEVHPNPAEALSDGAQSLDAAAFARMMADVRRVAEAIGRRAA
jgi:3-deoxy-7-phosphoheptulonate synthase